MDPIAVPPSRAPGRLLIPAVIAAATVAAFLPSVRGEFLLWDDDANFLFNQHYRGFTADNLKWMFTNAFGHYMPLTWLTLALDYTLWGMNPAGYHATNLALHALNAILFFFVLRRLVRLAAPDLEPSKIDLSAAAGALCFSIHPLRVESVAWITERRDVLSGVFFLLTVLAYLRWAEAPGPRRMALTTLAFAAMLLSKTMGLTLPLVFLVLDVYPLRRFPRESAGRLLKEKIPLLALMGGALVLLSISAGRAGGMSGRDHYPLIQSLARPGYALTFYVAKTLLPVGLSPLYWYRPELGLPQVVGWVLLLALTAAVILRRQRFPGALAGWMAYGLLMAPASGLVSMGSFTGADHYTYVACLPFAALAAATAVYLFRRWPAAAVSGLSAAVLIAFAAWTWSYCGVWTNSVALWSRAVALDPDVYFSRTNLGRALAARGEWDRAIEQYTRSIELFPGWFETWGHRARARLNRADAAGAIEDATRALRLEPGWAEGHDTRGLGWSALGRSREAIDDFSGALKIRPQFMEARVHRANERAKVGDLDGAIADFNAAIEFDPQPHLLARRGMTRAARGDFAGAIDDFSTALKRAPAVWPQRAQVEAMLQRARSELKP